MLVRFAFLAVLSAALAGPAGAEEEGPEKKPPVVVRAAGALEGYTLIAPLNSKDTFLVDLDGRVVHKWTSEFPPGQSARLLENGHLFRCARDPGESSFHAGGEGGRIEEFDWDGKLVWSYVHSNAAERQHHDAVPTPNGNVLVITWEKKTKEEAVAAGRDAEAAEEGLWPDAIVEIEPVRPAGGKEVWRWRAWDHLVQDRDPKLPNFGVVADHPERLDVNVLRPAPETREPEGPSDEAVERLEGLGYIGGGSRRRRESNPEGPEGEGRGGDRGRGMRADWNHVNSIAYHAERDEILLSSHNQHEIWIIDHSTTTADAAGRTGGRSGKGGDLLYRWGNPRAYHAGGESDQVLFGQHDARWIEKGKPGAGNILVFNNGMKGGFGPGIFQTEPGEGRRSSVLEIVPPMGPDGRYVRDGKTSFGPAAPVWSCGDRVGDPAFFSALISGAERLANGNTLVCVGIQNRVFEVTPEGRVVWDYRNPHGAGEGGFPPPGVLPPGGDRPRGEGPGGFPPFPGLFRAQRVPANHPALKGKTLEPIAVTDEKA